MHLVISRSKHYAKFTRPFSPTQMPKKIKKAVWPRETTCFLFITLKQKYLRCSVVRGKSVCQADVSVGPHFPRKFCPTGQGILSASRIICPGLGGKSVCQAGLILYLVALHSYKSSYETTSQKLIKRPGVQLQLYMHAAIYLIYDAIDLI